MFRYTPARQSVSIALLGKFNPAIFSPDWLERYDIIPGTSAQEGKVTVIHPEYSEIEVGPNIRFSIQPERFSIEFAEEPFVKALDAIILIFREILSHTPITAIGVNYAIHFALDSIDQRAQLGRALAPVEPWGEWGQSLNNENPAQIGGMIRVVMEETHPTDRQKGYRRVYIEPSVRSEYVDRLVGVYMAVNDHYEVDEAGDLGSSKAMEILAEKFDSSINKSKSIVASMMDYAGEMK